MKGHRNRTQKNIPHDGRHGVGPEISGSKGQRNIRVEGSDALWSGAPLAELDVERLRHSVQLVEQPKQEPEPFKCPFLDGIMGVLSRTSVITIQQTASRYLSVKGTRVETL